jgi:ankyrin repeat protein
MTRNIFDLYKQEGNTALMLAIMNGYTNIVSLLLSSSNIDKNIQNDVISNI